MFPFYTHEKTRKTFGFLLFSEGVKWGRNSRQEVFFKKGVLENFAKFTGKHLCQNGTPPVAASDGRIGQKWV